MRRSVMSETTITKEQIAEARKAALAQASEAIAKILDEYEVDLVATPQIADGRIVSQIQLVNK